MSFKKTGISPNIPGSLTDNLCDVLQTSSGVLENFLEIADTLTEISIDMTAALTWSAPRCHHRRLSP
jgi:hypothetical protein